MNEELKRHVKDLQHKSNMFNRSYQREEIGLMSSVT